MDGQTIHFAGIGGIGMSALAAMARRRGAVVTGCDREESGVIGRLRAAGIPVTIGHAASHVADADLVVHTSAIPADHPELVAACDRRIGRGAFLARLMDGTEAWGVAGSHGKTTTTWLLARILVEAGRD
ncbi:MAG: Mur ligase domain-containing protein, partial [Planctomycetes bacterium]|nr:Mur ligase domain-containing protein [Planctomycetota bacterium]